MRKNRVAVPTKGDRGFKGVVSDAFCRAKASKTTDIDVKDIENVEVIQNSAASIKNCAGPIVAKTFADSRADTVLASELGSGVSSLLDHLQIAKFKVKEDIHVAEAIRDFLGRKTQSLS